MSRLDDLHRRLYRLRRRRRTFRWELAYSGVAVAALWGLGVALLVDWIFQMPVAPRSVLLALWAAMLLWAFFRYALPWLGTREDELEIALLVEGQQHIDSDLVAALQFESPDAPGWGSVELEQAVIEGVAAKGKMLNVMQSLPRAERRRRLELLTVTLLAWVVVAALFPQHLAVFCNRLLLGARHYPSRTQIETITVNGQAVDPVALGQIPQDQPWWTAFTAWGPAVENAPTIYVGYGQVVRFRVACSGALPEDGKIVLHEPRSGAHVRLDLEPFNDPVASHVAGQVVYMAEVPKLVETVDYQIYLGDAWTDPARVEPSRLPLVDLDLEVIPPSYAKRNGDSTLMPKGIRQVSVIEGSQVLIRLRSDKPLREATAKLDDKVYPLVREAAGDEDSPELWKLNPQDTPLDVVLRPVRYAVQVVDREAQQLERPLEGMVRVLADLPPRIVARTYTPLVLPTTGEPVIVYGAVDDHALARIWLSYEVVRGNGRTAAGPENGEMEIYRLPSGKIPVRIMDGEYPFRLRDLKEFHLEKGDSVKVTLLAMDYRGSREGKSTAAEPLVFQVTDELGLKMSLQEGDKQTAQQLKTMIQRQLGIGGSP
ncbi:MAG: hypothetical protein ABSG68_25840 [Thermoguttaceae bacterium]|jgi:hypothetical protein